MNVILGKPARDVVIDALILLLVRELYENPPADEYECDIYRYKGKKYYLQIKEIK